MKKVTNLFLHPTKKQAIIITIVWIIGILLLLIGVTDFFTEGFDRKKMFLIYFLLFTCSTSLFTLWRNYWLSQQKEKK
jgi:hypothetical protein